MGTVRAVVGPVGAVVGPVGAVGAGGAVGPTSPRRRGVKMVVRGCAEDHQPEETQTGDFPGFNSSGRTEERDMVRTMFLRFCRDRLECGIRSPQPPEASVGSSARGHGRKGAVVRAETKSASRAVLQVLDSWDESLPGAGPETS